MLCRKCGWAISAVVIAALLLAAGASAKDPDFLNLVVYSKMEAEADMYRYSYLVFPEDLGSGYKYKDLKYLGNIFQCEAAVDSVDWESFQLWTNAGDAAKWVELLEHGFVNEPVSDTDFWGGKLRTPGHTKFKADGDGIGFEGTTPYDWAGFGSNLLAYAEDADDPFLAYTFLSSYLPVEGSWIAADGDKLDPVGGLMMVPGEVPVVPEPATLALLGTGLLALAGVARRR